METYIYGLDVSLTNTGVAIFTNEGVFVECSSIDTTKEKVLRRKLVIIAKEYIKFIKEYPPSVIVIEQGFSRFNTSTQMIFRCMGVTNYIFSEYEQIMIPSTTIKKVITGRGNAKKDEVRDVIFELYPYIKCNNFDESDAVAVVLTYLQNKKELISNA